MWAWIGLDGGKDEKDAVHVSGGVRLCDRVAFTIFANAFALLKRIKQQIKTQRQTLLCFLLLARESAYCIHLST